MRAARPETAEIKKDWPVKGRLSSCAPIYRRSMGWQLNSKRPVETGQQDESCPTLHRASDHRRARRYAAGVKPVVRRNAVVSRL